jgi:hypothetical protein
MSRNILDESANGVADEPVRRGRKSVASHQKLRQVDRITCRNEDNGSKAQDYEFGNIIIPDRDLTGNGPIRRSQIDAEVSHTHQMPKAEEAQRSSIKPAKAKIPPPLDWKQSRRSVVKFHHIYCGDYQMLVV